MCVLATVSPGMIMLCSASSRTCAHQSLLALVTVLVAAVFTTLFALVHRSIRRPPPADPEPLEVTVPGHEGVLPPPYPSSTTPRHHSVPSVMMDLFHRGPHDQLQAEIVRSLTPRTIDRVHQNRPVTQVWEHLHLLTFDLPGVVSGEALHSAQLRLTLTFLDTSLEPVTDVESSVRVYYGWGSGNDGAVLNQQVHDQATNKRVIFNCTDLILKFLKLQKHQGGELQLLVGVSLAAGVKVHTLLMSRGGDHQPLLLLLYQPTHNLQASSQMDVSTTPGERQRRDTQAEAEDYEEETNRVWGGALRPRRSRNLCRRRPLYVEFSEINYDSWIVAPNGYQAYQCVGKCWYPLSDHLSPTKHAIVQTLMHGVHPAKTSRACCVPTRLDSISVLYLDSQGVLTYRLSYRDMVVAECGCR